jgi:aspartate racemase
MKTIGMIGGVSWQSSAEYYRIINHETMNRLGASHSAELIMYSLDFCPVAELEEKGKWDDLARILINGINRIERAGAEFVIIASNTLHKVADQIERSTNIPLLHIADALANEIRATGISAVGLVGTRFVMEQAFYKDKLATYGLTVLTPELTDRKTMHEIIYNELCLGIVSQQARERVLKMITTLERAGAEAIVLANTELPLLVQPDASSIKIFDTMRIHAIAAVEFALEK